MITTNTTDFSFIDSHCHLDFPPLCNQLDETLSQAARAGVKTLIAPAVTADRFSTIMQLAADHPAIYAALGLHPIYITQHTDADLKQLETQLQTKHPKLVAIGEIGLGFSLADCWRVPQITLLRRQLELAKRYDLPVILHSRRSHDILASELKRAKLARTGVVHGFSGSLTQAQRFVDLGYAIGVGGVITYPRANKTRSTIAALPLSSLLLETDSPDMPLMGFQGQPNRPERLAQIFAVLCQLRPHERPADIATSLYQNTVQYFLYRARHHLKSG